MKYSFLTLQQPMDALIRNVSRELLLPAFEKGISPDMIDHKDDKSIVTSVDIEAQRIFEEELTKLIPGSCVIGEENSDLKPTADTFKTSEYAWIVDAVDGTHHFVTHNPAFTTMVCLCYKQQPIYGWVYLPTEDRLFSGGSGVGVFDNGKKLQRDTQPQPLHELVGSLSPDAFGLFEKGVIENCKKFAGLKRHLCAGYKFAGLLTDALDFAAFGRAAPWDLAAGFVLLEEKGGHAATWHNTPLDLYTIWEHKREWYLATSRKDQWQDIHNGIFEGVTPPGVAAPGMFDLLLNPKVS